MNGRRIYEKVREAARVMFEFERDGVLYRLVKYEDYFWPEEQVKTLSIPQTREWVRVPQNSPIMAWAVEALLAEVLLARVKIEALGRQAVRDRADALRASQDRNQGAGCRVLGAGPERNEFRGPGGGCP